MCMIPQYNTGGGRQQQKRGDYNVYCKMHYNGRYNSGQHTYYNTGGSGKTGEIIMYIILHYNIGRGRETAKEGEL